jgi:hypothetical protein
VRGSPRSGRARLAPRAALVLLAAASLTACRDGGNAALAAPDAHKEKLRAFWTDYHAATAARTKGAFASAAEGYRRALERDPRHEDSLFYLAVSLQETGRYAEEAALLRRLIALNPESNRAHTQLGVLLATPAPGAEPDLEAAVAEFERNREINAEESGPFQRRGLLELRRGRLAEARASLALASGSGAPEAVFLSGLVDYLEGRHAGAAARFRSVLEANERERAISGRGVFSEGDVASDAARQNLTAFERAGIKSLLFLYWSSRRLGAYPPEVPDRFRFHGRRGEIAPFRSTPVAGSASGRSVFFDHDADGKPDLVVARESGVVLLRNTRSGFQDVTASSGLDAIGGAWDAAAIARGGRPPDLYLVRSGYMGVGRNTLLRREEERYRDVTMESGLRGERATARAIAADLTGDGRTDLLELGHPGPTWRAVRLYAADGPRFQDRAGPLALEEGAAAVDAAVADYDGDGTLDVFLLGWKTPGRLFLQAEGTFRDATAEAGLGGVGGHGYSAIAFDYDRDGHPDLLVTASAPHELSLQRLLDPKVRGARQTPRLFRNKGQARFEEVTAAVGLDRSFGVMQAASADFDGDGWTDLAFATGGLERERLEPSLILRNDQGRAFVDWAYLPGFDRPTNALGLAVADANGDGRPDLFLSGQGLLLNRTALGGHPGPEDRPPRGPALSPDDLPLGAAPPHPARLRRPRPRQRDRGGLRSPGH